ncbi:hypothetical protein N9H19_00930 [Flavobacteriales bacterium]|nr:hypothetical protein [Flavobacteriales bacterium]
MNQKLISRLLWPVIFFLGYMVVKSPVNQILFEKAFNERKTDVIQKLVDIRSAQVAFKEKNKAYAGDFNTLIDFVKNDSIAIIKAIGEVPDSLTEDQALNLGIISRDSAYISVYESVFSAEYIQNRESRLPLNIDELALVPYSESNKLFKIESGNIEKGKVVVQVFEVSTDFASFMDGIDADNKGIDLQKPLMVGSMVEPKINGNWGE